MRLNNCIPTEGQGGGQQSAAARPSRYDVLIVGDDLAGVALAVRLAASGWRVGLLGADTDGAGEADDDLLPSSGAGQLLRLGLSSTVLDRILKPAPGLLAIWGDGGRAAFAEHALETGWLVERDVLGQQLHRRAGAAGAERLPCGRIDGLQRLERIDAWLVRIRRDDESQLVMARYLVDACAAGAALAQQLGARRIDVDPMTRVTIDCAPDAAALDEPLMDVIEIAPTGWWHAHTTASGSWQISLSTDADLLAQAGVAEAPRLIEAMHHAPAVAQRYAMVEQVRQVKVRDVASPRLDRAGGRGWLAVGAAAVGGDPLVTNELQWALTCAELAQACLLRTAAGDATALPSYLAMIDRTGQAWRSLRRTFYEEALAAVDGPFWQRRRPAPAVWRRQSHAARTTAPAAMPQLALAA